MKRTLPFILFLLLSSAVFPQITTPIRKAGFGVDADLRSNYFNGNNEGAYDDWFAYPGSVGTGVNVIDTTGAAAILAGYNSDVSPYPKRMASFYRGMSKPPFTVFNNRLWLDALFVRDYHGTDTTVYVGSNKNGSSPAIWNGGVQGVPDKNDILDVMVHVRREGPNTTDSLWMFGGISLDNVTGNRYFDFEMYQTDIYYDRPSGKFYNYGPDAGHTAWLFDAAGNITRPGDIIFSGSFQSGVLSEIVARIWVKKTDWQTITPASFNYSGQFDGDGSGAVYGYATISPNTLGAFYTGLGSASGTWTGPFGLVLQDNSLAVPNSAHGIATTTNGEYLADQFIEFGVNLTKLGLDPVTLLGGDICGTPFNRIIIKTRSSESFTAELKDFVAPTDLFLAPRAELATATPFICDTGSVAEIHVTNPLATSSYQWATPDGNIVGSTTGPSINVDTPGVYIVTQYLQAGCSLYATDTLQVISFSGCTVLQNNLTNFNGIINDGVAKLKWSVQENSYISSFELERSYDGIHYTLIKRISPTTVAGRTVYYYDDNVSGSSAVNVYYRLKINAISGVKKFSRIIAIPVAGKNSIGLSVLPNPAKDFVHLSVYSTRNSFARVYVYDATGRLAKTKQVYLQKGSNTVDIEGFEQYPSGTYLVLLNCDKEIISQKFLIVK